MDNPEDNYNELLKEREQLDMKRQQISIRESKERMKYFMGKSTDFNRLYSSFVSDDRSMSAELCFLTVLHLANENNLSLEQVDDYNFRIKWLAGLNLFLFSGTQLLLQFIIQYWMS